MKRLRLLGPALAWVVVGSGCERSPVALPVVGPPPPTLPAPVASSAPVLPETPLDGDIVLPTLPVRLQMFDAVVRSITRLDGDGLVFRAKRKESWDATVARLRHEAEAAGSLTDFGRVFKRLDATYPNLHTRVHLRRELDAVKSLGRLKLPLTVRPELLEQGKRGRWRVSTVDPAILPASAIAAGDVVVAINGRPLSEWAAENEIFCELPLAEQCDAELWDSLRKELLSWDRKEKLVLGVLHAGSSGSVTDVVVPLVAKLDLPPDEPGHNEERPPCGATPARYPGFHVAYRGSHACAFESPTRPGVVVLRIESFVYDDFDAASSVAGETELFYENYWKEHVARIKTLVVDVIGNHGGDAPIGYYELLFAQPFQEEYVRFKKIAELERPDILKALFWGDGGKQIWLDALRKDGSLAATKENDFLPHIPQFCADKRRDCRDSMWSPRPTAFRGDVRLLVDPWCVSSCVGMAYELAQVLTPRARLFGLPDSGDSAFSRVAVLVSPTASGRVLVEVTPTKQATNVSSPEPWVRQIISVTLSTDAQGATISGMPQRLSAWVPRAFSDSDDAWAAKALDVALRAH